MRGEALASMEKRSIMALVVGSWLAEVTEVKEAEIGVRRGWEVGGVLEVAASELSDLVGVDTDCT